MPTRSNCENVKAIVFTPDLPLIKVINEIAGIYYMGSLKVLLAILFIGFVIQLFNVFILTRRRMETLSIRNKILLLMVAAVFLSIVSFTKYLIEFLDDFICGFNYSYINQIFELVNIIVFTISHETIIRCVLYITLTRVNIVIKTRYSKKYCISRKLIFWFTVVSMSLVFLNQVIRIAGREIEEIEDPVSYSLIVENFAEANCTLPQNTHLYRIHIKSIECKMTKLRSIVSTFAGEIIPCAILLISTIFLAIEVRRIDENKRSSNEQKKKSTQNVQSLLIFLILFFLSEIPLAIIYGIGMISSADFSAIDVLYVQEDCFIFLNLNIGIFVYCTMSSLYRDTVKKMFGFGDREKIIEVQTNNQSRTTVIR